MIIDLNKAQSDPFQNKVFDICICGAGVAGITLATNLSKKLNIALLEAGGFDYSDESQDVYKGSVIGREYYPLEETRMRYFGGTSNVWSGWCRPLDPHDFEPKRYVEYSGWPITRNDLEPYLEKAKVILDIPEVNDTRDQFNHSLSRSADLKEIKFWFSRPTRFGDKYRNEIENAENITCCLNANLTDIVLSENLSRVKKIKVRNYGGKSYMLNTRIFILATGGIENARIMLNCNKQIKEGLGNSAGLVGRFFAEHPHYKIGEFIIEDRFRKYRYELASTYLSPSESFMKQEKILNFGLRVFGNEELYSDSFKDKVKSILCGWSPDLAKTIFSSKCKNIDLSKDGIVGIASEQAPNLSSRILLSSEIDRFGMRRAALDWRLSEIDIRTIKRSVMRFGEAFAALGIGRVKVAQWLLSEPVEFPGLRHAEIGGNHHMCTTRMGSSPKNGVVDFNQKVFGIDNFYVAGSSVFPTTGHANPTFTIVQTSLRLADYLNGTVRGVAWNIM